MRGRACLLWVAAALSAATLVGCAQPTRSSFPSDLPVVPPTGTITSSSFVRLFAENCVRNFPDSGDMARAFLDDGFVEGEFNQGTGERTGEWFLEHEADGLRASISTAVIVEKRSLNFVGD